MNTILEQINTTGKAFVEFAVPMLVQSGVLIVILLLVDLALRKKVKAVFRYCIWMLVLLKLILPTSLSSPLSLGYWFGDHLAYVAESRTAGAPETEAEAEEPALANMLHIIEPVPIEEGRPTPAVLPVMPDVETSVTEVVRPPAVPVTPITWQGVVFLLWLAVVIAMGLLLLQRAMFVRRLVAQAKEANALMNDALEYCCRCMGVKRKVGLKVSANATSPAVCGLFRPVILLPHKLAPSLGSRGLRAVLLHELAHIRRGDLWVNLVQTVLQIAYFYNPLLWLANAMIRRVREQAIDETVLVAMGEKAQQYPQTLVNVAKLAFKRPVLSLRLIGVVESKSALAGRIKHILNRPMPKSAKVGVVGVLAVIIAAAVLLLMAKTKENQKLLKGIDEKLKVTDKAGELTINSLYMPSPNGKSLVGTNKVTLYVDVTNNSKKDIYLGLEYYTDSGYIAEVFSPGATSLAQIKKVPANWQGKLEYPIYYNRFVKGGYVKITLARCAGKQIMKEKRLAFLPPEVEVIYEKKHNIVSIDDTEPDAGALTDSSFAATLPNGVTVELVGLGRNPWESDQEWWQPDGTEIEKPEFKANEPPHKWPTGPNRLQFQCAALFKFSNHLGKDVSVPEVTFTDILLNSGLISKIADDGTQVTYIVSVPNEGVVPNKADISLAIGNIPFKKARTPSKKFNEKMHEVYTLEDNSVVIRHPLRIDHYLGTLTVDLTCPKKDFEFRIIAELKNGQTEQWHGGSVGKEVRFFHTTPRRENIKVQDIKQLIIEYRPYEWITFKNVSLRPGLKTDVQVEGERQSSRSNLIEKLQAAIVGGDISKVEKLIGEGVSVNMPGKEGRTPLRWAVDGGHKEIVELLIRNDANVNTPDDYGATLLHITGTKPKADTAKYLDIAGILIANGADVNAKARSNRTPLHFCAKYGNKDFSELLVASGASIDLKDDFGKTPLLYAAGVHKNVSELLIENGADVTAKDKYGQTPLHLAANWGHVDIVKLFLDQGTDINAKDNNGLTPLDYATKKKYWDVMKLLVANGGYSAYKLENFELKRVFLPDVDDQAVMLDLASGQLVDIPEPVTGLEVLAAIDKLDKGDITYDARNLIFVRGATSNKSDVQAGPGSVKVYKIIDGWHLPERMIVTTQSGEQYELSIIGANKKGCRINYYHLVKADVQVEGEYNNNLYQKQGSIRYALEFIGTPEELIDTTFISKHGQLANPRQLEFANKFFSLRKSKDVDMFISLLSDGTKKQLNDDNNKQMVHHHIRKIKDGTFLYGEYDFKFFATFREFTEKDSDTLKKHVSFAETPSHVIHYWHFHKPNYMLIGGTYYLIEDEGSYKIVPETLLHGEITRAAKKQKPSGPKEYGIVAFKQTDNAYAQPAVWKYHWNIELSPDVSENNTFQILKTTKVVSGQADLHPEIAAQKIIDESMIEKYKYDILKCRFYVGNSEPRYNYHQYGRQLSGWLCGLSIANTSKSTPMLFPGKDVTNVNPNKQGNFIGSDLELLSFETSEGNIKYEHKVILRKDDSPEAKSAALLRLEQMTRRRISNKKLQYLDRILTAYANDHNSEYPDRLDQIKPYDTDEWLDWLLENIEYLGKGKTLTETSKTVIAYDKTLLKKAGSTNVLFNDGPVQYCNPNWLKKIGITVDQKPAVQVEVGTTNEADEVRYEGRTIEQWISQFDSESYDDRREATGALTRIGRPVVPAMIEQMKKGGMRASCARGVLGKMGPEAEDVVPWLIKVALDKDVRIGKGWESKASYRENVVSCLNYMTWARDQVIPVLQRIAEDDEDDTRLRRVAVLFLRDIGKEAIPILRKVTETQEDEIQDAAHHALAQVLEREEGLSKEDYYTPLIEKDPFDASVPSYLAAMKSPGNLWRPHPLTQKIKRLYRQRLEEEPDAQLAWRLATIIQNGLRNTDIVWAAPTGGGASQWDREDPAESYATLAEVLELGFRHAEANSELRLKFGISLAKLRLLESDWDGMNEMLQALGQEPIPKESRQWLPAPPMDWEEGLSLRWKIADESMRLGNCSLEFRIEKDGKGLKGVHLLVKRAPEPTNVIQTGISIDTLFFQPYPLAWRYSFGYMGNDRMRTRYAVSDESGVVRFDGLPNIPIKIEVLVPTANFAEAASRWELWMEVEPGKFKIAKVYGAPEEVVNVRKPPAVVELKEGETVYYPRLVVRPAFGRPSLKVERLEARATHGTAVQVEVGRSDKSAGNGVLPSKQVSEAKTE